MREVGLGDVDIKSRPVEFSGGVADGMDVPDDSVEGVAAGADGEELVCRVGVVICYSNTVKTVFSSSVGGGGNVLVKEFEAGGVLI
jgi:hypothetical protein